VRGFVSKGLYPPDFTGNTTAWNYIDAERYYRDFRHGVQTKGAHSNEPVGTVIAQKPLNAELYNSGLPLELTYSIGPDPLNEIEITGQGVVGAGTSTYAVNKNKEKSIRLKYRKTVQFFSSDQPDKVSEEQVDIGPGGQVRLGADMIYDQKGEIDIAIDYDKISAEYL
jgi:beta-lactam-binding protein with PASTA domain